jgi:hypothetical protein
MNGLDHQRASPGNDISKTSAVLFRKNLQEFLWYLASKKVRHDGPASPQFKIPRKRTPGYLEQVV